MIEADPNWRISMTPEEMVRRIAELEEEVRHQKLGKELFQLSAIAEMNRLSTYEPMTLEELQALITAPQGTPIRQIIEEVERAES